jgi:hypothetical protein
LVVLVGLYFAVYEGMIEPILPGHHFGSGDAMELGGGLLGVIAGLGSVALGEIIGVLFAIEANTRASAESQAPTGKE